MISVPDTAVAEDTSDNSRWAAIAWVIFLVLGVLIVLVGTYWIIGGLNYDDVGGRAMGYHVIAMVLGALLVAIGFLHFLVARSIRRHQPSGRRAGIAIAVLGTLLGVYLVPSALTLRYRFVPGTEATVAEPDLYAISIALFGAAYAIALVSLILGGKQFKRSEVA